jgi:hypothetical protein
MKNRVLAIFFLLTVSLGHASAQTLVEKLYVMRSDTTTVDPYSGMTRTCVAVLPDGRYRMERSFQNSSGGDPSTKVFVDKLSPEELKALEAILENDELQKIKTEPTHGGIIKDMDMLSLSVPREHTMQNIEFTTAAQRKPYEKALKPFLNSLKAIEKRKVQPSKTETPNSCEVPRVMYKTTYKATDQPQDMPVQP